MPPVGSPPPSRLRVRVLTAWLAAVLPLCVLAVAWDWFARPPGPTGKALAMDLELLEGGAPEVVVLGSSLARTNVDLDTLAKELGVARRRVALLTLPNATAAHWYAVLENRVFAKGYRPRVVVVVGALTTMVTPEVLMDTNGERLVNLLGPDEPVIAAKVFKSSNPYEFRWLSLRERAGELRDALILGWRDLAVAALFLGRSETQGGARLVRRANDAVFADEAMEYALHDAQPTGLYVGEVERIDLKGLDVERDSLLPDLTALAGQFGARIAFVRTPFPPSNADNDVVPPEMERSAASAMARGGAAYFDLRGLNLDETYFRDMRHMSVEGATLFTRALARRILDADLMSVGRGASAGEEVRATAASRSGRTVELASFSPRAGCVWAAPSGPWAPIADAQLARLGASGGGPVTVELDGVAVPWRSGAGLDGSCEPGFSVGEDLIRVTLPAGARGDTLRARLLPDVSTDGGDGHVARWWVYPGTSLDLTFEGPWPHPPEAFLAMWIGELVGVGDKSSVRVTVFGQAVPQEQQGRRVWARFQPDAAPVDRPWSVHVEVASGGPFLLIRNLAIGAAPYTSHLIGASDSLFGASARIVGGRREDTLIHTTFASDPPALHPTTSFGAAPLSTASWPLPELAALADAPDPKARHVESCSPVRVYEDGLVLPRAHVTCQDMADLKDGRSCHAGDALYFSASDGTNPVSNGRTYTLGLDPSRLCPRRTQVHNTTPLRDSLWVYPGDQVEIAVAPEQLRGFLQGADQLEFAADPFLAQPGARLHVALVAGGVVLREEDVLATRAGDREFRLRVLTPPLPPMQEDVRLVVTNPDAHAYWLLVMAALSESSPFTPTGAPERGVVRASGPGASEAPEYAAGEADRVARDPSLFDDPDPVEGVRLPVSVSRSGRAPDLEPPGDPAAVRDGVVELRARSLWAISNPALARRGLGWVSPLRVDVAGRGLRPAASHRAFRDAACLRDCFLHQGESVLVRSDRPVPTADLRLSLSDDVPVVGPRGERAYWVYPGTRMTLTWDLSWTDPGATLEVHLTEIRSDRTSAWGKPTLRVRGVDGIFQPGEAWSASRVYLGAPAGGPLVVEVSVPADSPISMLRGVELVDGVHRWTLLPDPAGPASKGKN